MANPESKTCSVMENTCEPLLVPTTAKLKFVAVSAARFETLSILLCPGTMEAGSNAQTAGAAPEQPRATVPEYPEALATEIRNSAASAPITTETAELLGASEYATAPVPANEILCGLPVALSLMVIAPARAPTSFGENVTSRKQELPEARVSIQEAICVKSPSIAIPLRASGPVPLLANTTRCAPLVVPTGSLPKSSVAGVSVTAGATPRPEREMM